MRDHRKARILDAHLAGEGLQQPDELAPVHRPHGDVCDVHVVPEAGLGILRAVVDVGEQVTDEAVVLEQAEVQRGVVLVLEPEPSRDQRLLLLHLGRIDLALERDDAPEMMRGEACDLDVRHAGILAQGAPAEMRGAS